MEENEKTLTETIGAFLGMAKRHAFYLLIHESPHSIFRRYMRAER